MTKGPLAAAEVVRDITGTEKVNPVGYCVGGTLLAITLSWLVEGEDENPSARRPSWSRCTTSRRWGTRRSS